MISGCDATFSGSTGSFDESYTQAAFFVSNNPRFIGNINSTIIGNINYGIIRNIKSGVIGDINSQIPENKLSRGTVLGPSHDRKSYQSSPCNQRRDA